MPSSAELLNQILTRSGLDRRDGHPLYRYRVTVDELEALRESLRASIERYSDLMTQEDYAAFCLFASEWFRRNYDDGPWRWEIIFDGLQWRPYYIDRLNRNTSQIVSSGLRWWGIEIIRFELSRRFLGTIVCQGGFPINTLRNEGAGLSRMLKACLRDHERFPSEPLDETLYRYIHYVSQTLQIDEFRRLVADLVQAIASLRRQSDDSLTRGLTRVEFLDQTSPGWETQLPLRVEEPEAKEILLSLLDAAKAEPFSRHSLSITTSMVCSSNTARIVRTLRFPASLSEEEFRRVCRIEASKELLSRMTGYLQAGAQRIPAISISRSNDGSGFRFVKQAVPSLSGPQAMLDTSLVLAVGGEEIQKISVPGGEALPESPWIFTSDDSHQLIGVGSVRPRDESVFVAVPGSYEVSPSEGAEVVEQLFTISERRVFKVTGEIFVLCDDLRYRIATKAEANRDCLYELRGKSKRLGTAGSQVWCGAPSVWLIPLDDDATPAQVPREQLQWKPVSGGTWSNDFSNCLGYVQIRVCQDGDTRYLARAIVMPSSTDLRVLPGDKTGEGSLRISGLGNCRLGVDRDENFEITASRDEGVVVLTVKVVGTRPGLIRLQFGFENGNTCEVSVVCPTSAATVLNVLGQPVPFTTAFPTDRLDGLTLQVIQPESRAPLIFWPYNSLLIDQLKETNVPGVFEYPLSYITSYATELLACSDDPDGKVQFGIGHNVALRPKFTLSVARYSYALERVRPLPDTEENQNTTDICVKEIAKGLVRFDACKLNIVPLGSPNDVMPGETIIERGEGIWSVQHTDYPAGYYLATASDAEENSYRPLRFVVKATALRATAEQPIEGVPNFSKVMNMQDKDARLQAWDDYFKGIAANPAHPDWTQLDDFVNSIETLPVTTFEAVAAITRNHSAAARYGIRFPKRDRLWRKFEQLPFLWSAIPVKAWLITAARYWSFVKSTLQEQGIDEESADRILKEAQNHFLEEAPNRSEHMTSIVLAMFASNHFGINFSESLGVLVGRLTMDVRNREQTRLIASRNKFDSRSTWPNCRVDCSIDERLLLRQFQLSIEDSHDNQWAVLNGPSVAAVKAIYGDGLRPDEVIQYKRLRAFDSEWYDIANAVAMNTLLQKRCESEPNFLTDILESMDS